MRHIPFILAFFVLLPACRLAWAAPPNPLPDTVALAMDGDIADQMITGIHTFLDRQIGEKREERFRSWPKPQSPNAIPLELQSEYFAATKLLRESLAYRIGIRESRAAEPQLRIELPWAGHDDARDTSGLGISSVCWNVFEDVIVYGICVTPNAPAPQARSPKAIVIAIPDADQSPEQLCGQGPEASSYAIELARRGVHVFVPEVIQRTEEARQGRAVLTDQEFLYRSSFVLGRHPLGYQVQSIQSLIDGIRQRFPDTPIGLAGWGEGGWIALHTAALDDRVHSTVVSGHFQSREEIWREPIHRNVQGLLRQHGDAELAALVAPRNFILDPIPGPKVLVAGQGAAPGLLNGPAPDKVAMEWNRAKSLVGVWGLGASLQEVDPALAATPKSNHAGEPSAAALVRLLNLLTTDSSPQSEAIPRWQPFHTYDERRKRTLQMWDRHQQRVLERSHLERTDYWKQLQTKSLTEFDATIAPYREDFRNEVIGAWETPKRSPNPRSRYLKSIDGIAEYEVVLDVFDNVFAYGKLLLPPEPLNAWSDSKSNANALTKRPCVVFQHGLEGRPDDTITGDHPAYHDVSMQLARQGYIVFAPQNLYLLEDRFRELQRKSNPLGKTLFSTMVSQHEVIVDWLKSIPIIDPERIAFYGLSYGGKSAMRIPALIPSYCLSICSADFNDWVWKNASTSSPYSYVWTKEYEIFEFDLGPKFNYAEMATLIAPRPFMVERGHFDGVAPDDRVGAEFAKVNHLYSALLKLPNRARIEWFPGPHTIHGKGTFEFLRQHLKP
jgi:dienelactone hydrolase